MWGACDPGMKMIYDLLSPQCKKMKNWDGGEVSGGPKDTKSIWGVKGDRQDWLHSVQGPVKRQIPLFKKQAENAIKSTKM